ncbi:HPr kinase/phosphorylase [Ruegeria sp. HKCCD7255]|uniref:HPr kinase/phosphorylase n=1 Tax=Ruegeria sp. HKCCD7255 TaxID=2683004 RepID=UPI0014889CF5|nr:HPr kinase/phosphatase C-terminal domain-containing protein [Ruegeria sp. HKCCD7255]
MTVTTLSETAGLDQACIHATCVSVGGKGLLLIGASGSGKSTLALQMMALGAQLVADDRVDLWLQADAVMAVAPTRLRGLIEARGIGLLQAVASEAVPITYVIDLDQTEPARLPDPVQVSVLGQSVPLLRAHGLTNLPAALMQLAKKGRVEPQWPSK